MDQCMEVWMQFGMLITKYNFAFATKQQIILGSYRKQFTDAYSSYFMPALHNNEVTCRHNL